MRRLRRVAGPAGRLAVIAVAAAVTVPALATAAWADDSLVSAEPAAGAVLGEAPGAVILRFTGAVSGADSHIAVATAGGEQVADGEAVQTGQREMRQPIRATAPGDLTVAYHVIFLDGASATGVYRFSAGTGVPPAPLSATAQQQATAEVSQHRHQVDGASAVLLVVDGAVLAVVVLLLRRRPRDEHRAGKVAWRYREQ